MEKVSVVKAAIEAASKTDGKVGSVSRPGKREASGGEIVTAMATVGGSKAFFSLALVAAYRTGSVIPEAWTLNYTEAEAQSVSVAELRNRMIALTRGSE